MDQGMCIIDKRDGEPLYNTNGEPFVWENLELALNQVHLLDPSGKGHYTVFGYAMFYNDDGTLRK